MKCRENCINFVANIILKLKKTEYSGVQICMSMLSIVTLCSLRAIGKEKSAE